MHNINQSLSDAAIASELYSRLEAYRKQRSIAQLELAQRLGIAPKTYRNIKTGACSVSVLLMVLRELNLLDNLNLLIPQQALRPTDVLKPGRGKNHHALPVSKALKARQFIK